MKVLVLVIFISYSRDRFKLRQGKNAKWKDKLMFSMFCIWLNWASPASLQFLSYIDPIIASAIV